jgi:acyl-CoA reductase-like NAD-dependent aldehyde dehydrogenase
MRCAHLTSLSCHAASDEDSRETIRLAQAAFESGIWSRASRHHRADVLDKSATLLTAELPELIPLEVRQTGRAIRESTLTPRARLHYSIPLRP